MNKEFEKLFLKQNDSDVDKIQNVVIGGCLGVIIALIASWAGFHIFMNEFVRELTWQKTLLIWYSLIFLVSRLK